MPGESHGQRSLVGYSLWGRKESNTTERLQFSSVTIIRVYSWFYIRVFYTQNPPNILQLHVSVQPECFSFISKGVCPCGSVDKESACNARDLGSIPGLGRSPGEGKGYLLQYSGLENSMDYSPWGCKELDTTERLSLSLSKRTKTTVWSWLILIELRFIPVSPCMLVA